MTSRSTTQVQGRRRGGVDLHQPAGGRPADIQVAKSWKDGVHTSVVSRKLVTGSKFDVQFADLAARYGFGFAAFDNAQVRHAVHTDPLYLLFAK